MINAASIPNTVLVAKERATATLTRSALGLWSVARTTVLGVTEMTAVPLPQQLQQLQLLLLQLQLQPLLLQQLQPLQPQQMRPPVSMTMNIMMEQDLEMGLKFSKAISRAASRTANQPIPLLHTLSTTPQTRHGLVVA